MKIIKSLFFFLYSLHVINNVYFSYFLSCRAKPQKKILVIKWGKLKGYRRFSLVSFLFLTCKECIIITGTKRSLISHSFHLQCSGVSWFAFPGAVNLTFGFHYSLYKKKYVVKRKSRCGQKIKKETRK